MKTFVYIMLALAALVAFMSACSSQGRVTGSKPVGQTPVATAEQNPPERSANGSRKTEGSGQKLETANENSVARGNDVSVASETDSRPRENRGMADDLGLPTDNATQDDSSQDDSSSKDAGSPVKTDEEEIEEETTEDPREENAEINIPDAGQSDAGAAQADAGNSAPPADPHVFATQELGALVRVGENTEVIPAEKPFWADDALTTAAFERENGMQYSVLVYERRPDELFADWLMRSKVGGTTVSRWNFRIKNSRRAYVYATDDYGAVPNVHIIVPTNRFVYYFRYESEMFEVPDDFIYFIREVEVQ